jgi:hypothetical protein
LSAHLRLEALIAASRATNPFERQQFYNANLGLPYAETGAGITMEVLEACMDDPSIWPEEGGVAMGVDVGKVCHYVIRRRNGDRYYLLEADTVDSFERIGSLIRNYGVRSCVIDANPETHAARELQASLPGIVRLCYYSESLPGKRLERGAYHVNRTFEMDEVVTRFASGNNRIPLGARYTGGNVRANRGEYLRQLMAETRVYEKDATGNPVARYRGSGNSHWLHAEVYCSLASIDLPGGSMLTPALATTASRLGPVAAHRTGSRLDGLPGRRRGAGRAAQQADYYIR